MTAKQVVTEVLAQLPDDCSLEEIVYRLELRRKIAESEAAIDRGEYHTHEEVLQMIDQWLEE